MTVPERIRWVIELLDPHPGDRVLEVGCGSGVAAAVVAEQLTGGHLTAIDRSAAAVRRAADRLVRHIATGRVALEQRALADLEGAGRFDTAFAVDVNVFWTTPADAECEVLRRVVRPGGTVVLAYGGHTATRTDVAPAVSAALRRHGFDPAVRAGPGGALVAVTARVAP